MIPLVCRHFLQVHKEYPSRPKFWTVVAECISHSYFMWFLNTASNMEELEIIIGALPKPTFLPQMLAAAAFCAPGLRCLTLLDVGDCCEHFLHSIALLTQLTRLEIENLDFTDDDSRATFSSLSSLQSLQVGFRALLTRTLVLTATLSSALLRP